MTHVLITWLQLALIASAILLAGTKLSHYGEGIARRTGLPGGWVGLVLVATVTSLPELVSGATAATVADAPEVAVGNVLGACVLNLAMIALLDALHRSASIYSVASQGHALGAGFVVLMLGAVGFALVLPAVAEGAPLRVAHVSLVTPVLFALYATAVRTVWLYEKRAGVTADRSDAAELLPLRTLAIRYALASAVVVAAALALPFVATRLAAQMGWSEGFVGTLLVAATTTLPEMAVTIAALRIGALDLAIGNLLGSSLFNLAILGIDDLLYTAGPLYAAVAGTHALSVAAGVMMGGAVIIALVARQSARLLNAVSAASLLIALLFFANAWLQFRHGR
jgi:cation:H+ antiporter